MTSITAPLSGANINIQNSWVESHIPWLRQLRGRHIKSIGVPALMAQWNHDPFLMGRK